jgi:hypothetical protein
MENSQGDKPHDPTWIGASGESKRDIGKLRDEVQVMGGKTIDDYWGINNLTRNVIID